MRSVDDIREVKTKWVHSYLPLYAVLVVFGAVSVAPHCGRHVLVYVRVTESVGAGRVNTIKLKCWSRDRVALMTYPG